MLYRKVPENEDKLSVLGFGCMRLPIKEDGTIDEKRATKQVRYAIDHGVNYIDTAWPYHMGENEPFLGHALADGYREKVKLATKLPSWLIKSREDMDSFLNAQLKRLNTDHIDYYLVHGLAGEVWDILEPLGVTDFLDKAKADGRIVNAGFSFHGSIGDFKRIVDAYPWTFCQIQYNFMDEKHQAGTEGLKYAASKSMGIIIMEPLLGGNLANRVPSEVKEIWNEASVKRTPAEWALRWIWNHPEVTTVLSGMNEEAQIEENLKTADEAYPNSLNEAELQLVNRVEQKYRQLIKIGCTGCQYCMPCPSGVSIPECFDIYNNLHMFGNVDGSKFAYAMRMSGAFTDSEPGGFASLCTECGQCMEKCPQSLKIPDLLKAVAEELEGSDFEQRLAMIRQSLRKTKPQNNIQD
ncbi:aldo/keto reductase [Methanosarcina sp.]|uniref:aldo/keto reductase n=1 Tax=Methanosarcina sp. TaxID=2213 RepID=UPI00298881D5|nr:aldo/keto reductase [Methanosarcina sp.]MDW5550249.1 aldo/keto reductase [Methanosarcina sp.]MDW5554077.1 aldo/keto reductase [Methanosarcina sp.]MDW5560272.1 aldo/keto reductase [Methanosarcina sp.]